MFIQKKEDQRAIIQQKIDSCTSEIERLELEKKEAWDSIKDFRVSANTADAVYARMTRITSQIKRMKTDRKKLQKKLL